MSTIEKFEASYVPEPNTGCWLWTRSLNSLGYGKICGFGNERSMLAHRWSYEYFKGPIPAGLVLDHLCCTPACVNPEHLEAVTQGENTRRGPVGRNLRTGLCRRGHPIRMKPNGRHSYCQVCNTEWARTHRKKGIRGAL